MRNMTGRMSNMADYETYSKTEDYWWVAIPVTKGNRSMTALEWFKSLDPEIRLWVIRQAYEGKTSRLKVE